MTVSRFRIILCIVAAIAALAGLADATYLTVQALTGETLVCGGSPDCFRVLGSAYARVQGIPVAALGMLAYFSVFSFATFVAFSYGRVRIFLTLTVGAMFLATLWLLAYAEELLWDRGIWHERGWLFGGEWELGGLRRLIVPLLALPQITHYLLDGFIWRRRTNPSFQLISHSAHGVARAAEPQR